MRKKRHFCAEAVWALGMVLMATGVACISKSNFGYSMVVAPVYLLYKKLSPVFGFLTFGITEYLFQGLLILFLTALTRRFRLRYLLSFATAVIYGYLFDAMLFVTGYLPVGGLIGRCVWFALGEGAIVVAVVCFMHTYLAPEAYELVVKEISSVYRKPFARVKLIYDLSSLAVAVALSLCLFGGGAFRNFSVAGLWHAALDGYVIEGIGIGTVIAAIVGGPLIGLVDRWFTQVFDTTPAIPRFRTAGEERQRGEGGDKETATCPPVKSADGTPTLQEMTGVTPTSEQDGGAKMP